MIARPLSTLRAILWKLTHPGRLTPEERAAFVQTQTCHECNGRHKPKPCPAPYCSECHENHPPPMCAAPPVQRCLECYERHEPVCDVVTLSRAELVTLLTQAMDVGYEMCDDGMARADHAIARVTVPGYDPGDSEVAEKLLDASLARRAR